MDQKFSVFVLQHRRVSERDREYVKMIGVYSSRSAAEEAVKRLVIQPGFRDWPDILDLKCDSEGSGFCIDEIEIDKDNWSEGFVTDPQ